MSLPTTDWENLDWAALERLRAGDLLGVVGSTLAVLTGSASIEAFVTFFTHRMLA